MVDVQPYNKVKAVNNTSIGYYILSPLEFKRYYDNPIESEGDWYDVGSAVHCLVLQPAEFYDKFIVLDYKKPQNEQQRAFCDRYIKLIENDPLSLDVASNDDYLISAYSESYSAKNKSDKKILEEATELRLQLSDYMQSFKLKLDGKTVLSSALMDSVKMCCKSLMVNPKSDLVVMGYGSDDNNMFIKNETEIYFEYKGIPCKSKLDRLIIDKTAKKIIIIDVKTTSKQIGKFYESFRDFDYERQFAFYCLASYEYLEKQLNVPNLDEYNVSCVCAVVSTKEPYESRIYSLPMEKIMFGVQNIKRILDDLNWHFENDKWQYPRCYYDEGRNYEVLDY